MNLQSIYRTEEDLVSNDFKYYLLITANHAFIDGFSIYQALRYLLKFIEDYDQCRNASLGFKTLPLLPSIEDLSKPRINDFEMDPLRKRVFEKRDIPERPVLSVNERRDQSVSNINQNGENANDILDINDNLFLSFSELNEYKASRKDVRDLQIFVDSTTMSLLTQKCKFHGLKFNGV